ncbi:MAG: MBOAT family O-acyltransferase [Pseudomonadota bacterium]
MLFNSVPFLVAFLPAALALFYLAARLGGGEAARWTLIAASFFFYAWTLPWHLLLLVGSLLINFQAGRWIEAAEGDRRWWLTAGFIALNLGLIAWFKYLDFLIGTISAALGFDPHFLAIALPLAISFFTFQQIAYLVNAYRGQSLQPTISEYMSFVAFFPHLIAGPLVQHSDIIPQFRDPRTYRFDLERFTAGLTVFLLGLAKKVVLADQFGVYADTTFNGVARAIDPTLWEAWGGILAYTLQLYFDFSGYSDMAIGLGLMFGIVMPVNFNSPYKATSIIDFWGRWHMTLSRFLRDFLYVPLGGNRKGPVRRYANLMLTMLLGGLWHGAAWTFVLWGGLHGAYLMVNHGFRAVAKGVQGRAVALLGWALTFVAVALAWVPFRAHDLKSMGAILSGAFGGHGAALPGELVEKLPLLGLLGAPLGKLPLAADGTNLGFLSMWLLLVFGLALVWFAPNIQQMSEKTRRWMIVASFALVIQKVFFSGAISSFLYFRF